MDRPETRYAKTVDGVHIAYQVFGDGPPDLVIHVPFISNVDAFWDFPEFARFLSGFARHARVIVFDRRGLGVSDRPASLDALAIEKGMEDLSAVLDAAGSTRAALFGAEAGGSLMLLFAASFPERVLALGLFAPSIYYWKTPEFPFGMSEEDAAEWRARIQTEWGTASFWRKNALEMGEDQSDAEVERWARFTRLSASPSTALALDEVERAIDVRAVLPQIQVPTLVMETSGDAERWWGGRRRGRLIADRIPGARYAEIDDPVHFPTRPAAYEPFIEFLNGVRERESVFDRVLATVLFTDIVDSTAQSATLGDREWRRVREEHDRIVRAQLARHRGRAIKTMGDGFLATFDGPARGVYCAKEIVERVRPLGIEVRSGLHTGEVELDGDDVAGIGVAIGARVGAKAGPSEVLVSQTVKDLVAGSGLLFEDAGEHELKGVPDRWHLYRVVPS
jgi:class 3 adenylate cyclase/alpha-beta hydrolase superfamily lysophospholipase